MKYFWPLVALLWCLPGAAVHAGDAYLCTAEMVTGFAYDKGQRSWHPARFKGEGQYVVSRSRAGGAEWQVAQVGDTAVSAFCGDGFSAAGVLTCRGFDEFKFNRTNLRFIHAYLVGYWTDRHDGRSGSDASLFKEGENSPFLEIGQCAPM